MHNDLMNVQCPRCGPEPKVLTQKENTTFPYGHSGIEIPVTLNIHTCTSCKEQFLTGESEEVKEQAIVEYISKY